MERRDFFRLAMRGAFGAAVAQGYDWDRLLWVPKPIVVVPGSLNTLITPEWVMAEMRRLPMPRFSMFGRDFMVDGNALLELG